MKPGGKLLISCFLINDSSRFHYKSGLSYIDFDTNLLEGADVYYKDDDGQLTAVVPNAPN